MKALINNVNDSDMEIRTWSHFSTKHENVVSQSLPWEGLFAKLKKFLNLKHDA